MAQQFAPHGFKTPSIIGNSQNCYNGAIYLVILELKLCGAYTYVSSLPLQTNVGPILLSANPYQDVGNPLTLSSAHAASRCPQLLRVIHEAVRQQSETGYPQAIILRYVWWMP